MMPNFKHGPSSGDRRPGGSTMRLAVALAPLILAAGCATFPTLNVEADRPDARPEDARDPLPFPNGASTDPTSRNARTVLNIPQSGRPAATTRRPATEADIAALVPDEIVDANLGPQPIPQFVATVFGSVLSVPFTLAPDVSTRTEFIAGGTGGTISKRALFRLTQQSLQQYGIEVYIEGGFVTIGNPDAGSIGAQVVRDRSSPRTSNRVVQFFTVQSIDVNALQGLLTDLFPNLGGARVTPDALSNSLIISGPGRDVAQLVNVLREIDQPRFAGTEVLRVEPVFVATEALASSLEQVLTTEGYVVSRQPLAGRAVVILSFPLANQILIFARDPELLARARYWVETLDQASALGERNASFVFQVRNTDAQSLGQIASGQAPTASAAQPPTGVPGTIAVGADQGAQGLQSAGAATAGASGSFLGGRLLTDPVGNRIIFTGTAADYAQLRSLLTTLDRPAPQVVIEVMIAEVTLTDATSLGINLSGTQVRGDGIASGQTGGLGLGSGGVLATFVGPEFRASLNAAASNNRVNILQRPQLVVRSGGSARFQVGTDVPIITSQRATDTSQNGNGTDILQSVQYRQTGVILDLKPVVYGDRVDIAISQENSTAGASPDGIASPTILNRSLTTQIAITDGWTGVLGGLISNNYSKVNTGVPFLKDIPLLGSAFQSNVVEGDRTELLVLITPYIIRGDEDMADFADRYTRDINAAFRTGRGWSYTLTPFSFGSRFRGIGADLPSAQRASDRDRRRQDAVEPEAVPPTVTDTTPPIVVVQPQPDRPAPTIEPQR